jgi:hypothetical protein
MGDEKWHESWDSRRTEASLNVRFAKKWLKTNVICRHADQTERLQWVVTQCYDGKQSDEPRLVLSQEPRHASRTNRLQRVMKKTPAEFRDPIDLERYLRFNIQWRFREVMVREIATACKYMPTVLLELVIGYI